MGDVVDIKPTRLDENHAFVADCCRYQEGLLTEANMKLKYGFADSIWEKLGDNTALLEAVEEEKIRRIRTGQQKRERAQQLITKAPAILDGIMSDTSASPRHRVDAIKTLDGFAANPQEGAPAADRFSIVINLGSDVDGKPIVERFDKSRAINAEDVAPNGSGTPQRSLPVANKSWDDADHNDVVVAPPVKRPAKPPVKTLEHESAGVEERKTPEQIALESMMRY